MICTTLIDENKIGISTNIFNNPRSLGPLLESLGLQGFKVIEVEFDKEAKSILQLDAQELNSWSQEVVSIKNKHGLDITVHAPYLGKDTDLAADNLAQRNIAINTMLRTMEIMSIIGASNMTFHPGYLTSNSDDNQLYLNLRQSLKVLADRAKILGIHLCLENTGNERPRYIVLNADQQKELYKDFGIKITLDLIHFASFIPEGDEFYNQLVDLLPYIQHVHFADMVLPHHAHLPLGKGNFQYQKALEFLYERGYSGYAIVEESAYGYTSDEYVREVINFKNLLVATKEIA